MQNENDFNLADYMDKKPTAHERDAGIKYLKRIGFDEQNKTEIFQFYFKGRVATFREIYRKEETRDGKRGELLTLIRGKSHAGGAIHYDAFRVFGGDLYFLGECSTQIVDKSVRTQAMRSALKFN